MASLQLPDSLVSAQWLREHLDDASLIIFDASWHMPATGRDALADGLDEAGSAFKVGRACGVGARHGLGFGVVRLRRVCRTGDEKD